MSSDMKVHWNQDYQQVDHHNLDRRPHSECISLELLLGKDYPDIELTHWLSDVTKHTAKDMHPIRITHSIINKLTKI